MNLGGTIGWGVFHMKFSVLVRDCTNQKQNTVMTQLLRWWLAYGVKEEALLVLFRAKYPEQD